MTRLNRIFAVSFIAMLAVPTVHAKVVTQTNIVGTNGVSVTVPTSGTNAGKVQISGPTMPTIDNALSDSSTNAVQNKVVNSALAGKVPTTRTVNGKALSGNISLGASDVGAVPTSRTVNSKALSGDITLSGADIAATGYTKPTTTSAIAATDTVNAALGKLEKALDGKQASGSYVPTSRTVNGKALSGNISLGASDVGAVPTSRTVNSKALSGDITLSGADVAVTGYAKAETAAAIATTDTVNAALGKLEKALDGKQASGSYVPTSRTVNGKALSGNISLGASDVGAVAAAQGSSAANKAVITNSSGNVTTAKIAGSAVTSAKIADGTIVNADIADGTIANAKLANVATASTDSTENANNLVTVGIAYDIANAAAGAAVSTAASSYQPKSSSNVATAGTYIVTGNNVASNLAKLDTGLAKVRTAAGAIQIPNGGETATTYATIWVQ